MSHLEKSVVFLGVLLILVALTGCGKRGHGGGLLGIVQTIQARTYENDGDAYGEIKAQLSTGNIQLPSFDFPIPNASHPQIVYGRLAMSPSAVGSELTLQVDITRISHEATPKGTLPNGNPIPIGGLGNTTIVAVPVNGTGAQVYVAFDQDIALIGTAIPIREFDHLGGSIGGANLFQSFSFNNVRGSAGIFIGRSAGQSGIALFADLGGLIQHSSPKALKLAEAFSDEMAPRQITPLNMNPARRKRNAIYFYLFQLDQKRARLNVH